MKIVEALKSQKVFLTNEIKPKRMSYLPNKKKWWVLDLKSDKLITYKTQTEAIEELLR